MNEFFPIIIIEIVITFGGVLLLYWWSMRDIKLWREKKREQREQTDKAGKHQQVLISSFPLLGTEQTAVNINRLILYVGFQLSPGAFDLSLSPSKLGPGYAVAVSIRCILYLQSYSNFASIETAPSDVLLNLKFWYIITVRLSPDGLIVVISVKYLEKGVSPTNCHPERAELSGSKVPIIKNIFVNNEVILLEVRSVILFVKSIDSALYNL